MAIFGETALAVSMLASFALAITGVRLAARPAHRQRGLLMIAAGIVLVGNVLIWTV